MGKPFAVNLWSSKNKHPRATILQGLEWVVQGIFTFALKNRIHQTFFVMTQQQFSKTAMLVTIVGEQFKLYGLGSPVPLSLGEGLGVRMAWERQPHGLGEKTSAEGSPTTEIRVQHLSEPGVKFSCLFSRRTYARAKRARLLSRTKEQA